MLYEETIKMSWILEKNHVLSCRKRGIYLYNAKHIIPRPFMMPVVAHFV